MGQPVIHFEVLGKDADRTQRYYSELFGWDIEPLPFENPTQYGLVKREGNTNADGIGIGGGVGGAPDDHPGHVTFYVEVRTWSQRWLRPRASAAHVRWGPTRFRAGQ